MPVHIGPVFWHLTGLPPDRLSLILPGGHLSNPESWWSDPKNK